MPHRVFITGASGFIGSHLVPALLQRGNAVTALVRAGSEKNLPPGCTVVVGDALRGASYANAISPADTFVHLIGVAHPSPKRAHEFHEIDLKSVQEAVPAARAAGVKHFVYLSVPQPLPIMKEYGEVRAEGEKIIRASGMAATFVRPFYVLGQQRWWPYPLLPAFWLLKIFKPSMGRRLYPVTIGEMVKAIGRSIEQPPDRERILEGVGVAEFADLE